MHPLNPAQYFSKLLCLTDDESRAILQNVIKKKQEYGECQTRSRMRVSPQ